MDTFSILTVGLLFIIIVGLIHLFREINTIILNQFTLRDTIESLAKSCHELNTYQAQFVELVGTIVKAKSHELKYYKDNSESK